MKKESIQLIVTFVLYTLLMLVIGSVIANNIKFNALQVQEAKFNEIISELRDSINTEISYRKNAENYSDSLEVLIEQLPDSMSFKTLENSVDSLILELKHNDSDKLILVSKIRILSKENEDLKNAPKAEATKILEEYLKSLTLKNEQNENNKEIHIHIHNSGSVVSDVEGVYSQR
jgi:hypothetical protein